jgi:hypothetical protein
VTDFTEKINYAWLDWKYVQHHERLEKFVLSLRPQLVCQECKGGGGWTEPILDDGTGPWEECGWCEGIGYVTPHIRGQWLKYKKLEKTNAPSAR